MSTIGVHWKTIAYYQSAFLVDQCHRNSICSACHLFAAKVYRVLLVNVYFSSSCLNKSLVEQRLGLSLIHTGFFVLTFLHMLFIVGFFFPEEYNFIHSSVTKIIMFPAIQSTLYPPPTVVCINLSYLPAVKLKMLCDFALPLSSIVFWNSY